MTMRLTPAQADRACGVLIASAAGDALGAGYEFGNVNAGFAADGGDDGPQATLFLEVCEGQQDLDGHHISMVGRVGGLIKDENASRFVRPDDRKIGDVGR